jgi:DeoR/GlpR family transcriptional regulator of sugar metabolism
VITAGPMFPPDTPKQAMTETFRRDLEQLIKSGLLSGSSGFVQEVLGALGELGRNPGRQQALKSSPQTETEAAIASALAISLGISIRTR